MRLIWRNFGGLSDGHMRIYAMLPTFYAIAIQRLDVVSLSVIVGDGKKTYAVFSCKSIKQAKWIARREYNRGHTNGHTYRTGQPGA